MKNLLNKKKLESLFNTEVFYADGEYSDEWDDFGNLLFSKLLSIDDKTDYAIKATGSGSILQQVATGCMVNNYDWAHLIRFYTVAALVKSNDLNILDIGCGEGVLRRILRRGNRIGKFNYVGVDARYNALRKSAEEVGKHQAAFICADINEPWNYLKNGKFDFVYAMEIIEHLTRKKGKKLLERCMLKMKDDGKLILSTPQFGKKKLTVKGKKNLKYNKGKEFFEAHLHEYTREELYELFDDIGLKIVSEHGYGTQIKIWENFIGDMGVNDGQHAAVKDIYNQLIKIVPKPIVISLMSYAYPQTATFLLYILEKK